MPSLKNEFIAAYKKQILPLLNKRFEKVTAHVNRVERKVDAVTADVIFIKKDVTSLSSIVHAISGVVETAPTRVEKVAPRRFVRGSKFKARKSKSARHLQVA